MLKRYAVHIKGYLREILITLGMAIAIYLLLQMVIQSSIVNNVSMQPTLLAGQRLLVLKAVYHFQQPTRGDIIILHPPVAPQEEWVKRLIGLPGDTVEVKNSQVYINGQPLDEPYIKSPPAYSFGPFMVPDSNYFVLGDNRNSSYDSHLNWTITRDKIVGKVWIRIWPFNEFGAIN